MKILLFSYNASYSHTNLAIRCIRDALERRGHSVVITEATEKDGYEGLLTALLRERADIYGFSSYIWNITATKRLASDLKKLLPESLFVFGGPEVSFHAEEFLAENPYADTVICGEGEEAFCSLAENPRRGIIVAEPYADFTDEGIHYRNDERTRSRIVYYESSRGCPFSCSYCLSGRSSALRMKSAQKTLSDLREFENTDGIRVVKFVDRTFNADRKRARSIWEGLLSKEYTKSYHFEICASLIEDEDIELLSRFPSGKIQLEIGVQSTNPRTLAAINRQDNTEKVLSVIERLHSLSNMHIHADLIAGLPHEDMASFEKSFNSLFGKCDMLQLGFLKLLKGAPLEADIKKHGYVFSSHPPYRVLKNNYMSAEELFTLDKIEKALDRFCSGAFSRAILLLTRHIEPFTALLELSAMESDITKLSQNAAYSLLYRYARSKGLADDIFTDALRLDFLLNEAGRLPRELSLESVIQKELRRDFLAENKDFFAPALEMYIFPSEKDKIYFIDRKNRIYKALSRA